MESEIYCLGLRALGDCLYNPASPKSYFTLGNLLSVIALLLAISQLTRPIIKFRIRAGNLKYKVLIVWIILAILFVFIATVLPFLPGKAVPVLGYPIIWELLSALIIVILSGYVIIKITKPVKFKKDNSIEYLNATASYIAKGDGERLVELAEEMISSIQLVIAAGNQYDMQKAKLSIDKEKVYLTSEMTNSAISILYAWSDELLCQQIVSRSPATAMEIINQLTKSPNSFVGHALSSEIVNQSFENEHSLLNRENKFSGLGYFNSFSNQLFGNWDFINGKHRPLASWKYWVGTADSWQFKKYCECANIAFKTYIDTKNYYQPMYALNTAMSSMESLAMKEISKIKASVADKSFENISILSEGYQLILETILSVDDYPDYDFNEVSYNSFEDLSVFGVIAKGVYDFFEKLAMLDGDDETIYLIAFLVWEKIFGHRSSKLSNEQKEIGKRLLFHIKRKIDENLSGKRSRYPLIVKLILTLNGIGHVVHDIKSDVHIFHSYFMNALKERFQLLYKQDADSALEMLPEFISYDPQKNKLIHKNSIGKETEMDLN